MNPEKLEIIIKELDLLNSNNWSKFKYSNKRGNLTKAMDKWVIYQIFGRTMPFHIVKDTSRFACDQEKERLINFSILFYELSCNRELDEYYLLFMNWNHSNNASTFKRLKEINEYHRVNESDLKFQLLTQLHMDTMFSFENEEAEDDYKRQYADHYIRDDKYECFNSDTYINEACFKWANAVNSVITHWVNEEYDNTLPVVQQRYSPLGPKCEDQFKIKYALCTGNMVSKYVAHNYELLNKAWTSMGNDPLPFDYEVSDEPSCVVDQLELLIRVNAIETQPGKPRIVMQSNDLYDIILNPFYKFVKKICSIFRCSFSTYQLNKNSKENSKYSIARLASSYANDLLDSFSSNSDLSSATDKLSSHAQTEMFMIFYDFLSLTAKESLDSIGITKEYVKAALDILSKSYIYTEFHDGNVVVGFPYFGQLQGLRGSFHMLHWNNMLYGLAAFLSCGLSMRDWNTMSMYNGDDGILPDVVIDKYKSYWINNSDSEVLSIDKSSSEESVGALKFCKSYIKTNKPSPRIINGLKPNQLIRIFNDPEQRKAFITCDIFNERLVRRLEYLIKELKDQYGVLGFLKGYSEEIIIKDVYDRMQRFRTATNFMLYQEIRDGFVGNREPKVIPAARYGIIDEFCPINRAKSYMITNSYISFDQLLNLYELRKFSSIISEDVSVLNPNSRIYDYLNSFKDSYILTGNIPEYNDRIEYYKYSAMVQILKGSGCDDKTAFIGFEVQSFIPQMISLTFSGYKNANHIIKCKITLE